MNDINFKEQPCIICNNLLQYLNYSNYSSYKCHHCAKNNIDVYVTTNCIYLRGYFGIWLIDNNLKVYKNIRSIWYDFSYYNLKYYFTLNNFNNVIDKIQKVNELG